MKTHLRINTLGHLCFNNVFNHVQLATQPWLTVCLRLSTKQFTHALVFDTYSYIHIYAYIYMYTFIIFRSCATSHTHAHADIPDMLGRARQDT